MRILQICNKAPYPPNDGSSIAICSLAEGLADNGAELHLLAINTKKHFKPDEQVPDTFRHKTHYRSVYKDTGTTAIGGLLNLFTAQSYFVSRFHFKAFEQALAEKLSSHTFDVVQVEGVFMAPYIPLIRQHSKAKVVLRTHNVEHQIWERHLMHEKRGLKQMYLQLQNRRLERFEISAFKAADAIVPITEIDRHQIGALAKGKPLFTCLTGVDLDKYRPAGTPAEPSTLFHFASMDWMPNVEAVEWLLREVWPLVSAGNSQVKLVLAGRGMPAVFKQARLDRVVVTEQVTDARQFYHDHDIMLVPLWSGSGLRIKLVEGLAYGKPIVTTSIGAEGIPYTPGKELLVADDAQSFAAAILELVNDAPRKAALTKEARHLAEACFDYKQLAARLIGFYNSL